MLKPCALVFSLVLLAACQPAPSAPAAPPVPPVPAAPPALTAESASNFAQITLRCVARAYPSQPGYMLNAPADVQLPNVVHPAFFGCYDWHSSVHGHWMLAHLLRLFPTLPEAPAIVAALDRNLSAKNLAVEAAYSAKPGTAAFERMYGWAWVLKLAEELHRSTSGDAKRWAQHLQPLTTAVVTRHREFLPEADIPDSNGRTSEQAFALGFALDYATAVGDAPLTDLVVARSRDYFLADADHPARLEPNGSDFLSPALAEADLMRRVLAPAEFARWFDAHLPAMQHGQPANLPTFAVVTDRSDPQLGHLDGLNLSRAWAMRHIAAALPADSRARAFLAAAAHAHAVDALRHVATGHYEGEHWLASFAVFLLTETPAVG